jgi:hypothetical protein
VEHLPGAGCEIGLFVSKKAPEYLSFRKYVSELSSAMYTDSNNNG